MQYEFVSTQILHLDSQFCGIRLFEFMAICEIFV